MKFPSWAVIFGRTNIEACNPPTAEEIRSMSWMLHGFGCMGIALFLLGWYLLENHNAPVSGSSFAWIGSSLFLACAFCATRSHATYARLPSEEDLYRLRCGGDLSKAILAYIHRVDTLGRRLTESEAKSIISIANKEIRLRSRQGLYAAPSEQTKD
ncbi:hypothetical protein N0754_19325 [Pseudomonas aeruginosa]|nr:hypothetical protein [Pseudomonas aeruginosa]MCS9764388.1 hypothetical protein [Pseudomonas aeruginosa]MCS9822428.1 hypothetical protein [Pseudomonas aeruginosa]MCT0241145.1 hypothetical protein [Pseudomonas aeruginosa]MCT0529993.1 hypothetical protein [Pseudomonas aeruginosa]